MKSYFKATWTVALILGALPAWAQTLADYTTLHVSFGCEYPDPDDAMSTKASTYEIWLYDGGIPQAEKHWDEARDFSAGRVLRGETGHLATFRNEEEEACVLAQAALLEDLGVDKQLWIGLVQNEFGDPDSPGNKANGWGWETGETFDYVNWANGEPNDAGGNEDHGTIGRYGYTGDMTTTDGVGWNDEDVTRPSLYGFVVEYDVAALGTVVLECAPDCTIEIPSANPQQNKIILPPGVGVGGSANVGVFLVRENCTVDVDPTKEFRLVKYGFDNPKKTIPVYNHLCANEWILITSKLDGFEIESGVVEAEFEPADFGLIPQLCAAYLPLPLAEPEKTALVTYLPESMMWSDNPFIRSGNWMQDFTFECGSSRGRMAGNKFFGIGLNHYYPASADVTLDLKDQAVTNLGYMLEWNADARSRGVIKQGDYTKMKRKIERAITEIGNLQIDEAITTLSDLQGKFLDATDFDTSKANSLNFHGEGLARLSNVLFLLKYYVDPYFPQ